jgi:hypothetical protein
MAEHREPGGGIHVTLDGPVQAGLAVPEMVQAGRFAEIREMFTPQLPAMVAAGPGRRTDQLARR